MLKELYLLWLRLAAPQDLHYINGADTLPPPLPPEQERAALDALTRAHLQDTVMHIQQELNTTIVMITHDVDEAVLLSDRVLMMTNGPAATVGEILAVDLPRPRHRVQLADDSRYHHLRQQILHFLYEKQPKAA